MASEDIGTIYKTQIPGYEDSADIQAALKLYHYGTTDVPTQESQILQNSVAGHLKALDTRVDSVEASGIGSSYSATEPTATDGFIWVNSTQTFGAVNGTIAAFQATAPSTGLAHGLLWVDSTTPNALVLKIYDSASSSWKVVG
jgi:hypothetical protein